MVAFADVRSKLTDDNWVLLSVARKLFAWQVRTAPWSVCELQSLEEVLLDEELLLLDDELLDDELLDDELLELVEVTVVPEPPPQAASSAHSATVDTANILL